MEKKAMARRSERWRYASDIRRESSRPPLFENVYHDTGVTYSQDAIITVRVLDVTTSHHEFYHNHLN